VRSYDNACNDLGGILWEAYDLYKFSFSEKPEIHPEFEMLMVGLMDDVGNLCEGRCDKRKHEPLPKNIIKAIKEDMMTETALNEALKSQAQERLNEDINKIFKPVEESLVGKGNIKTGLFYKGMSDDGEQLGEEHLKQMSLFEAVDHIKSIMKASLIESYHEEECRALISLIERKKKK